MQWLCGVYLFLINYLYKDEEEEDSEEGESTPEGMTINSSYENANLAEVDDEQQGSALCGASVSEASTSGSSSSGAASGEAPDLEVHNYAGEEESNEVDGLMASKVHGSGGDLSSTWRVMLMSYSSFCPRESLRQVDETEEKPSVDDESPLNEQGPTSSSEEENDQKDKHIEESGGNNNGDHDRVNKQQHVHKDRKEKQVVRESEPPTQRAMRELTDKWPTRTPTMERLAMDKLKRQTVILESLGSLVAAGREEVGQAKTTTSLTSKEGRELSQGDGAALRQPVFDYEKILQTGRWWQLLSQGLGSDQLMELCMALEKANPKDASDEDAKKALPKDGEALNVKNRKGKTKKPNGKSNEQEEMRTRARTKSNETLDLTIVSVANASLTSNDVDSGEKEAEEEKRKAEQANAELRRAEEEDADEALGSFVLYYSYHKKAEQVLKKQEEWPFVSLQLCQLLLTHTHRLVSNRNTNSGERLMTALLAMDVLMNHGNCKIFITFVMALVYFILFLSESNRQLLAQAKAIPVFGKILRRRSAHLPLLIADLQCINTICSNGTTHAKNSLSFGRNLTIPRSS